MTSPLVYRYDGDGVFSAATPYWARKADDAFVVGETYKLAEHQDRSGASHNAYFARLSELWQSRPDDLLTEYPNVESLRKRALIRCGYATERTFVASSKAEAQRLAAFLRPEDDYSIILVKECVVRIFNAASQSYRAMGRADFEASKTRVLEFVENLLGVSPALEAAE